MVFKTFSWEHNFYSDHGRISGVYQRISIYISSIYGNNNFDNRFHPFTLLMLFWWYHMLDCCESSWAVGLDGSAAVLYRAQLVSD